MWNAIKLREDFSSAALRRLARQSSDGDQIRRLLALAALRDGASRADAAKAGGMDRQTLRDWVHRFNAKGPAGLFTVKAGGAKPKLTEAQRARVAEQLEQGPIPAVHGVVRWRIVDLQQWIGEEFGISLSRPTVWRLMHDLGYSHVSGRPRSYRQNEDAIADFKKTSARSSARSAPGSKPARHSKSGSRMR